MERREYPDDVVRLIILTNTSILFEEDHSYVNLFHGLEIVIIILTLLSSLVTIYFGCTTRAAHFNLLNILILYEVLYFPFAIARIVLILIERRVFQFNGELSLSLFEGTITDSRDCKELPCVYFPLEPASQKFDALIFPLNYLQSC